LLLFMTLLLAVSLLGLAASGHFPADHRLPALRSAIGRWALYGSIGGGAVCLLVGLPLVWSAVPWYAVVIGGGAVVLFAPLVLQFLPDRFVDGYGALLAFSGAALLLMLAMIWIGGAGS
jgi:hypothetical protein